MVSPTTLVLGPEGQIFNNCLISEAKGDPVFLLPMDHENPGG